MKPYQNYRIFTKNFRYEVEPIHKNKVNIEYM